MNHDGKLRVIVCDADQPQATALFSLLTHHDKIDKVRMAQTLEQAEKQVQTGEYNTIFIDPLSFDLGYASEFIFRVRAKQPSIVFALFTDPRRAESVRSDFYRGERTRFRHYYRLNKGSQPEEFTDELNTVVESCREYLRILDERDRASDVIEQAQSLLTRSDSVERRDIAERLNRLEPLMERLVEHAALPPAATANRVFLSHRFADRGYVDGLARLLKDKGFEVVTGESASTYVSKAVLERIRRSEFFVCLMTRDEEKADGTYTTSDWVLEEKGAALAYGKYSVFLVEDGVNKIGGLQGDWQRHHFTSKSFMSAAFAAVEQLQAALGLGEDGDRGGR